MLNNNSRGEMALPILGGAATSRIYNGSNLSQQVPLAKTNKNTNLPTTTFSRTSAGSAGASEAHVRAAMLQSGFSLPLTANSERARLRTQQLGRSRRIEFGNTSTTSGKLSSHSPSPSSSTANLSMLLLENQQQQQQRPHTTNSSATTSRTKHFSSSSNVMTTNDLHSLVASATQKVDDEFEKQKRRKEAADFIFGTGTLKEFEEEKKQQQQQQQQQDEEGEHQQTTTSSRSQTPKWVEVTKNEEIILDRDRRESSFSHQFEFDDDDYDKTNRHQGKEIKRSPQRRRSPTTGEYIPQLSVPDSKLGDTLEDQRLPQPVILPRPSSLNVEEMQRRKAQQEKRKSLFNFEAASTVTTGVGRKPRPPSSSTTTTTSTTTCRPLMQSLSQTPSSRERANPHPSTPHPDMQFARWLTALSRTAQSATSRKPFQDKQRSEF